MNQNWYWFIKYDIGSSNCLFVPGDSMIPATLQMLPDHMNFGLSVIRSGSYAHTPGSRSRSKRWQINTPACILLWGWVNSVGQGGGASNFLPLLNWRTRCESLNFWRLKATHKLRDLVSADVSWAKWVTLTLFRRFTEDLSPVHSRKTPKELGCYTFTSGNTPCKQTGSFFWTRSSLMILAGRSLFTVTLPAF